MLINSEVQSIDGTIKMKRLHSQKVGFPRGHVRFVCLLLRFGSKCNVTTSMVPLFGAPFTMTSTDLNSELVKSTATQVLIGTNFDKQHLAVNARSLFTFMWCLGERAKRLMLRASQSPAMKGMIFCPEVLPLSP